MLNIGLIGKWHVHAPEYALAAVACGDVKIAAARDGMGETAAWLK